MYVCVCVCVVVSVYMRPSITSTAESDERFVANFLSVYAFISITFTRFSCCFFVCFCIFLSCISPFSSFPSTHIPPQTMFYFLIAYQIVNNKKTHLIDAIILCMHVLCVNVGVCVLCCVDKKKTGRGSQTIWNQREGRASSL